MTRTALALGMAAAALALNACDKADQPGGTPAGEAKDSAGAKTIAAGIDQNSRFFAAAKSAGHLAKDRRFRHLSGPIGRSAHAASKTRNRDHERGAAR